MDQTRYPHSHRVGPRDLEKGTVAFSRRDRPVREKAFLPSSEVVQTLSAILEEIQNNLFTRAKRSATNTRCGSIPKQIFTTSLPPRTRRNPRFMADLRWPIGRANRRSKRKSKRISKSLFVAFLSRPNSAENQASARFPASRAKGESCLGKHTNGRVRLPPDRVFQIAGLP